MKCSHCGADSSVLATRTYEEVFVHRRRKCFNEHVFTTYEVHPGNLDRRTLADTRRGVGEKAKAWQRREYVRKNASLSAKDLAARLNITDTRVRQLRVELRQPFSET